MTSGDFEQAKSLFIAGIGDFEAGRYAEAEQKFEASLGLLPGRISTLNNLAATRVKLGRADAALNAVERVLAVEPDNLDALSHRGAALVLLGRHAEALACFDRVLAADRARADVMFHRAMALGDLARDDEALRAFDAFIAVKPAHGEAWLRRGQSLHRLGESGRALESFQRAVDIDPDQAEAWTGRGGVLAELRRFDEAAESFNAAIARGGDPKLNGFFLSAIKSGAGEPAAAPPQYYVEGLFDAYADKFDDHLLHDLKYRAHIILIDGLKHNANRRFRHALDLGCGTGLCGQLVRDIADRLDGVDLSGNMLQKANALGIYASTERADILEYLARTEKRYDLVVSTDVFIYLGELDGVFAGVDRVLERDGMFCFSVELGEGPDDYALRQTLRYAHSERYLRTLAQRFGFTIVELMQQPIREDQQQPIDGLYAFLRK